MKKVKIFCVLCLLAFVLSGCKKKQVVSKVQPTEATASVTEVPQKVTEVPNEVTEVPTAEAPTIEVENKELEKKKQVLMIYMVGSNLESEAGAATDDINEIKSAQLEGENLSVYLCTGGSSFWWTDEIPADCCSICQVKDNKISNLTRMKSDNMGDPRTLTEFVDTVYETQKADSYSIIFWDHGSGAVLGFGADETHNFDMLSLPEMREAMKDTKLIQDGKRFSWCGFDACLMGMIEVGDMMSEFSDYMIASEEVETQYGWDYTCLNQISKNCDLPGNEIAGMILDSYQKSMVDSFYNTPDYTLSCFDLSKVKDVLGALDSFVTVAEKNLNEKGYSKIAKQRDGVRTFGKVSNIGFFDTIDLYDLADRFAKEYPEETDTLKTAIHNMVDCQVGNLAHANGVSIYFPYENREYAKAWLKLYEEIEFSPVYTDFIAGFTKILTGEQLADWNLSEDVPTKENKNDYSIYLTKDQVDHFARAKYSVWEKEDNKESYICWILSSDTRLSQDGELFGNFEGYRYYLSDDSGKCLPCCAIETEHTQEYQKFVIPVIVNPLQGENVKVGYIHFKIDQSHPKGVVLGVYYDCDTDSVLCPDKNVMELKEGDIIAPFYFSREMKKNEDGSLAPFEKWKSTSGLGDSLTVEGNLFISCQKPEEHSEYCLLFSVCDTQGNNFETNPIYLK